jgi:hypothetical protein
MTRISGAREKFSAVKRACEADAQRLCALVPANAAALLECLQANEALLSSGCNMVDVRRAVDAASIVDVVADMTSEDRAKEAVAILQGLDSVAFSRSQILIQFDNFDGLGDKANANRLLFNPQFVFGSGRQFAFQVKVPVTTLYPYATGAATQSGLANVVTAFAWGFFATRQVRQFLAVGLQWQTASQPVLGGAWLIQPVYAISVGLARWLSLTSQISWSRSFASDTFPSVNLLVFEPILVVNLPGRSYLAVDTKLGWDLDEGTFVPVMKGVAGLFLDRQKSLSISAWYQTSLTRDAAREIFDFGIGMGLAYFFDW